MRLSKLTSETAEGEEGEYREKIWGVLESILELLVEKRKAYGDDCFPLGDLSYFTHCFDKIKRLQHEIERTGEVREDDLRDLCGYVILWLTYYSYKGS